MVEEEIQTVGSATKFCKNHDGNMYRSQSQGGGLEVGEALGKDSCGTNYGVAFWKT